MSDQNSRPLDEAQKLVGELQEQAKSLGSETAQAIVSGLGRLGTLLKQAAAAGEGEDEEELPRARDPAHRPDARRLDGRACARGDT